MAQVSLPKRVFVSGCYDLLHSGHIAFFKEAAGYGDLYVAVGSDRTIQELKGRVPINTEAERLFMIQSISYVKQAFISRGSGMLDFEPEMREIQPDLFIVNEDGNIPEKQRLCENLGIEYLVLQREPYAGLTPRSSTALRSTCTIPYRIDLAGGWLDQPFVSRHHPGGVITVSIEPTVDFNERSGMATSTRLNAIDLWGPRLPVDNPAKLAKILFCYDNPPGTQEISGAQDTIGIVFPGLNLSFYEGEYWPSKIESFHDEKALQFLENALYLIPLGPREMDYAVLSKTCIDQARAKALAAATELCWEALQRQNIQQFGKSVRDSFEAQIAMFPLMVNESIFDLISRYQEQALGWKISGAGGGGYLILVSERPIDKAIRIHVRRKDGN